MEPMASNNLNEGLLQPAVPVNPSSEISIHINIGGYGQARRESIVLTKHVPSDTRKDVMRALQDMCDATREAFRSRDGDSPEVER